MSKTLTTKTGPSANWRNLQKTLSSKSKDDHTRKKRKLTSENSTTATGSQKISTIVTTPEAGPSNARNTSNAEDTKNGESLSALRRMIAGKVPYTEAQKLPGKYLAIDCEMVGVGLDGTESSLARVTIVNYYGAVQLDEFVRQRERVVDYRTQYSGIRESDMVKAKPFDQIQKQVAELLKDKILVGHAVHNDLKAHTQYFAGKHKVVRSKYVALRNLVKQELDVTIQSGEHSSLTDARATMAVYRLHRKEWEKGAVGVATAMLLKATSKKAMDSGSLSPKAQGKRKSADEDDETAYQAGDLDDEMRSSTRKVDKKAVKSQKITTVSKKGHKPTRTYPGGGRKGVSSGLSTIVRNGRRVRVGDGGRGESTRSGKSSDQWWKDV
ncbi:ribonuclease H-like protein [Marasmius fiardii PR-910]|nr:ribonuclease H-like protein [Marasmius fiardii PR-910]